MARHAASLCSRMRIVSALILCVFTRVLCCWLQVRRVLNQEGSCPSNPQRPMTGFVQQPPHPWSDMVWSPTLASPSQPFLPLHSCHPSTLGPCCVPLHGSSCATTPQLAAPPPLPPPLQVGCSEGHPWQPLAPAAAPSTPWLGTLSRGHRGGYIQGLVLPFSSLA